MRPLGQLYSLGPGREETRLGDRGLPAPLTPSVVFIQLLEVLSFFICALGIMTSFPKACEALRRQGRSECGGQALEEGPRRRSPTDYSEYFVPPNPWEDLLNHPNSTAQSLWVFSGSFSCHGAPVLPGKILTGHFWSLGSAMSGMNE